MADVDAVAVCRKDGPVEQPAARNRYAALIAVWQETIKGSRLRRAKWGNTMRSFLIHNGVLLQPGIQTQGDISLRGTEGRLPSRTTVSGIDIATFSHTIKQVRPKSAIHPRHAGGAQLPALGGVDTAWGVSL